MKAKQFKLENLQKAIENPTKTRLLLKIFNSDVTIEQLVDNMEPFLKIMNSTLIASQENLIKEPELITKIAVMLQPAIVLQALYNNKPSKIRDVLTNIMKFGCNPEVRSLFEGNHSQIKRNFPKIYSASFCEADDDIVYMLCEGDDTRCNTVIFDDLAVSEHSDRLIVNEEYNFEDEEF